MSWKKITPFIFSILNRHIWFSLWFACLFVVWSLEVFGLPPCLDSCRSCELNLPSIFVQYICPCLTHFCLLSVPVSESWSRSKGRCSLVGQQSTPSSVPLLPSAPFLSLQQKVTGQQQHPLGFGQVSSVILFKTILGIRQELNTSKCISEY